MKLYYYLVLPFLLSLLFCSTLVATEDLEVIVQSDVALTFGLSFINDNNHTTITLTQDIFYNLDIRKSGKFTIRSSPGSMRTLTLSSTSSIYLERGSNTSTHQTFQNLILAKQYSTDSLLTFTTPTQQDPVSTSQVSFINVTFNAPSTSYALILTNTYVYLKNCTFNFNTKFGFIFLRDSPATITGCSFMNTPKTIEIIRNYIHYQVTMDDCLFVNNTETAIQCFDVALKISNSKFYNNTGPLGGAIYFVIGFGLQQQTALEITYCDFNGNVATNNRATIYFTEGANLPSDTYSMIITKSTFGDKNGCLYQPCNVIQLSGSGVTSNSPSLKVGIYRSFFATSATMGVLTVLEKVSNQGIVYDSCLDGTSNNKTSQALKASGNVVFPMFDANICGTPFCPSSVPGFCELICPTLSTPIDCENFITDISAPSSIMSPSASGTSPSASSPSSTMAPSVSSAFASLSTPSPSSTMSPSTSSAFASSSAAASASGISLSFSTMSPSAFASPSASSPSSTMAPSTSSAMSASASLAPSSTESPSASPSSTMAPFTSSTMSPSSFVSPSSASSTKSPSVSPSSASLAPSSIESPSASPSSTMSPSSFASLAPSSATSASSTKSLSASPSSASSTKSPSASASVSTFASASSTTSSASTSASASAFAFAPSSTVSPLASASAFTSTASASASASSTNPFSPVPSDPFDIAVIIIVIVVVVLILLLLLVVILLVQRRRRHQRRAMGKMLSDWSSRFSFRNPVYIGGESQVEIPGNEVEYSNELNIEHVSSSNPYTTVAGVSTGAGNSSRVGQTTGFPLAHLRDSTQHLLENEREVQVLYSELVLDDAAVRESLTLVRDLGEGEFGKVFLATVPAKQVYDAAPDIIPLSSGNDNTLAYVAVKQLKLDADEKSRRDFASEISLMKSFKHPAIVRVIAALVEEEPFMLVLEFLPYSDLRTVLLKSVQANMPWTEPEIVHVLRQIGSGLAYLADLRFVHRDLAARNCLIGPNLTAKISDFGLARGLVNEGDYYKIQTEGKLPLKWMAPESLNYRKFSTASDVWSFGVVCWEVFTYGETPFKDVPFEKLATYLDQGGRLPCPRGCNNQIYQFLLRCWNKDPEERPDAVFCSNFFKFLLPNFTIRDMGKLVSSGGHSYVNIPNGH